MRSKIFAAAGIVAGAKAFFGFGPCSSSPSCKPENQYYELGRILGSWYVTDLDWVDHWQTFNFQCSLFEYQLNGEIYTETKMTNVFNVPQPHEITETTDAALREKIVYTDYENFAIRFECEDQLGGLMHARKATLLSRSEKLDESLKDKAKNFLKEACEYNGDVFLNDQWGLGCEFDSDKIIPAPVVPPPPTACIDDPSTWDHAVGVPSKIAHIAPTLQDGILKVQWLEPAVSVTPIERYKIEFKDSTDTYQELKGCLGCWSQIVDQHYCDVPLSQFFDSPMNLGAGDSIQIRGKAMNSGGYSDFTLSTTQVVLPSQVPSFPIDVRIYGGTSQVFVEWSPPAQSGRSEITKYQVRSSSCGNSGEIDATKSTFSLSNLQADTLCDISLSAFNSFGEGEKKEVEVRASIARGDISPAKTALYSDEGVSKLNISWHEPGSQKELTGFKVYFQVSGASNYITLPGCEVSKHSGSLATACQVMKADLESNNLLTGSGMTKEVTLYVQAITAQDDFQSSPPATYALWKAEAPSKWTTISSFSGTMASLSITCEHHEDPDVYVGSYELYMKRDKLHFSPPLSLNDQFLTSSTPSFTVTNLASGGDPYHFACIAVNSWGRGALNRGIVIYRYGTSSPSYAQNVRISQLTSTSGKVTWELPSETPTRLSYLQIQRRRASDESCEFYDFISSPTSRLSHQMSNLAPNTEYYFVVNYWGSNGVDTVVWFKTLPA